jgi:glucokinase
MKYRIGVDIGGMSVKIGVVDGEFNLVEKLRFPTGEDCTAEFIIEGIIKTCRELAAKYPIESIGIGSPGRVDQVNGVVIMAGNLPFRNEPIARKVSEALSLPTFVENDGSCALIGELAAGACKGCHDAVIITIGTGIGGAIAMNGKLVHGHKLGAGELGHFVIDRNGEQCTCGLKGCFEQYASATALIEQTERAIEECPESILAECGKEEVTGKTVFDAAEKGCETAKKVLEEYGRILSDGLNSLNHIFQPEMIVVSGGIANQGKTLLALVEPHLLPDTEVATTTLNGEGGIIGAALLGTEYNV